MADKMIIALVDSVQPDCQHILGYWLNGDGIKIEAFKYISDALPVLLNKRFPLIVTSLRAKHRNFKESGLEEVIGSDEEATFNMIRELRGEMSENKTTPILVADVVLPMADALYPRAETRLLEAGATKYVYLGEGGYRNLAYAIHRHYPKD